MRSQPLVLFFVFFSNFFCVTCALCTVFMYFFRINCKMSSKNTSNKSNNAAEDVSNVIFNKILSFSFKRCHFFCYLTQWVFCALRLGSTNYFPFQGRFFPFMGLSRRLALALKKARPSRLTHSIF